MDYSILSLAPILVCFTLIFISRNAFVSIICGIAVAVGIIFFKTDNFVLLTSVVDVFSSSSTVKTVVFILIVGAIIKVTELSGGVSGLIQYLEKKKINIKSKVLAQLCTMLIGICLFVDATSSMAVTVIIGRSFFKKAKLPKEKLALIANSTAAPIAWLIPFGGAGALMTGLISELDGIGNESFDYVLKAVPFQFYTIVLLLLLVVSILFRFEIGPIRNIEFSDDNINKSATSSEGKARNIVIPITTLLISIIGILLFTGNGDILSGDSSNAVFFGGVITLLVVLVYYVAQKICSIKEYLSWCFNGAKSMFVVTLLLAVALVFSDLLSKIGTANYMVSLFGSMSPNLLPLITLFLSAIIGFSTGTSGGTVAIVSSLILPMAIILEVNISLVLGAIVSGAVFGDQSTVISDSVIMTSSVTGVDPITHVKTQLPYTAIALCISAVLFLVIGFIIN